jgi:hypothetical protein
LHTYPTRHITKEYDRWGDIKEKKRTSWKVKDLSKIVLLPIIGGFVIQIIILLNADYLFSLTKYSEKQIPNNIGNDSLDESRKELLILKDLLSQLRETLLNQETASQKLQTSLIDATNHVNYQESNSIIVEQGDTLNNVGDAAASSVWQFWLDLLSVKWYMSFNLSMAEYIFKGWVGFIVCICILLTIAFFLIRFFLFVDPYICLCYVHLL